MTDDTLRPLTPQDQPWVDQFIASHWGSEVVVVHGTTYRPSRLPGLVAMSSGERVGLVTYTIVGEDCEIVTLNSTHEGKGVGSSLMEAMIQVAKGAACRRVWLITTNDNLRALGFYQRRGFVLVAVHRNAVEASRRLKPSIPLVGEDGIPLRDEIELERALVAGITE